MVRNKKYFYSFILSLLFVFIPFSVKAAGFIPCGNTSNPADACTLCHFLWMFQRIMEWGTTVTVVLGIVVIFIAGILYIVSSGNPGMIEKAKKAMTNALIGIVIVFLAWVIVNTILYVLGATTLEGDWDGSGSWLGTWFEISC